MPGVSLVAKLPRLYQIGHKICTYKPKPVLGLKPKPVNRFGQIE